MSLPGRWIGWALGAVTFAAAGCGLITGVDFGKVHLAADGGGGDGGHAGDAAAPDTASPPLEGGTEASTCTPDPSSKTCPGHCGTVFDNCNSPRLCPNSCAPNICGDAGTCVCISDPMWCKNRCGTGLMDNCNQPVNCGGCDGGLMCTSNACGCVPESVGAACGSKLCGQATNNCSQTVQCGNAGQCATPGAICMSDGSCCTDNGAACASRCSGVVVTDNCGQSVGCPVNCPTGQVCLGTNCCVPDPLTTTCAGVACGPATNNCGQVVSCPDTCASPNTCSGGGAGPNGCGCTPNDPCADRCSGTAVDSCGNTVTCSHSCGLDGLCPCAGGYCAAGGYCSCHPPPCM